MMQRTANENAACLRRICKRYDQPKIERLVQFPSIATSAMGNSYSGLPKETPELVCSAGVFRVLTNYSDIRTQSSRFAAMLVYKK